MGEPVRVKVRECACPGHPHNGEGDWVLLAATLPIDGGFAAEDDMVAWTRDIPSDASPKEREALIAQRFVQLQRRWSSTFIRHGAIGWNLLDESGEPLPFTPDAVLADYALARPVADEAADRYSEAVMRPFLQRQAARSPTGQITGSMSARRRRTRKPSGSSSPGTSAASPQ